MKKRAARVVEFIEAYCALPDGRPMRLDPWQRRFIADLYPDRPGAPRSVTRGLLSVAKKNGKTELAAALMLAHLTGPEAGHGERLISAAAGSREQAGIVFERAARMVAANPELTERIEVVASRKRMLHRARLNVYEAIPTTARSIQGELPALWIFDELGQSLDSDLYDALDRGQGTVAGRGLGIVISTHSHRPGNPLADLIEGVRRGQADGGMKHWTCHIYSGDPQAEDEFSMDNIRAANPGLGSIIDTEAVRHEIEEAKRMPGRRADFRAYRLNIDCRTSDDLIDPAVWQAAALPLRDREEVYAELAGEACIAGLDLSETTDLTSLALWFPEPGILTAVSWLPEGRLAERELDDRAPYREWARMGRLLTSPGPTIDPDSVVAYLGEVQRRFRLVEVRYDRWRIDAVKRRLDDLGLRLELVPFGQGFRDMGPAVEEFERLLLAGELRHDNDPVTNLCLRNTGVSVDVSSTSGARKPVKKSPTGRIDAAVAALMACADRGTQIRPRDAGAYIPGVMADAYRGGGIGDAR